MRLPQVAVDPDLELDVDHRGLDQRGLDQRQTERRQLSQPATVTSVGTPKLILHGQIRNLSEGGTQIMLEEPLPLFTLVRIEYDDNLLLGEVVYCQPEELGYLVGFRIEHGLFGLTALSDAMQSF